MTPTAHEVAVEWSKRTKMPQTEHPGIASRVGEAARIQARVIGALVLRDTRTRFGRTHLSFIVAILWPLTHLLIVYAGFVLISRVIPLGGDPGVFIASGVLPYILILYPSRMNAIAMIQHKSTLMFPVVKTTDIIIARSIVEFFSAYLVTFCFGLVLMALGVDIMPQSAATIAAALLASIYLGIGIGVLNVIMMTLFKFWLIVYIGIALLLYIFSGANTLQIGLSESTRNILWYNPMAHAVIWTRTAYYGEFAEIELSRTYMISIATVSILLGLIGDRLLRGRVLMA